MNLKKRYKIELPSLITIGFIVMVGLIIGYLGPFGSFLWPLSQRLFYWVMAVFIGYFVYYHTLSFSTWYFSGKKTNKILVYILTSFLAALVLSLLLLFFSFVFFDVTGNKFSIFLKLFPQVFLIGLIISFISNQFHKSIEKPLVNKENQKPMAGKIFLDRLPHKLGDKLVCFVMEDHYLKVTTTKGEHMLLMRMKDALNELEDYDGLQVHRSWWVARDAVARVKKKTRNMIVVLENQIEVPVSRTYVQKVKQALIK